MTHRERVLAAFAHQEADRVPMDLGGTLASTIVAAAYPALRRELGLPVKETVTAQKFASLAEVDDEVRGALEVDIVHAPRGFRAASASAAPLQTLSEDTFIDEWGVRWHRPQQGHYYVEKPPFADIATPAAVAAHPWPDQSALIDWHEMREALQRLRRTTDCAISLELQGRVMSIGQFLRGFEAWMMDLAINEPFVTALLERTTELQVRYNRTMLEQVGDLVDIVYTSDDLGGQNGTLMSVETFRRRLKPYLSRIWRQIGEQSSAYLVHHCCGSIYPFIGDMIDAGVQGLNPIQVSAANMDPARLKRDFGRHLCFWGGVDTRDVLPRGSVEAVRDEVQLRLRQMATGGGLILAAVHNIQPEVPAANVLALFRAGRELGRYPTA